MPLPLPLPLPLAAAVFLIAPAAPHPAAGLAIASPARVAVRPAPRVAPPRVVISEWYTLTVLGKRLGHLYVSSRPEAGGTRRDAYEMRLALEDDGDSAMWSRSESVTGPDGIERESTSVTKEGDRVTERETMVRRGGKVYLTTEEIGKPTVRRTLTAAAWDAQERTSSQPFLAAAKSATTGLKSGKTKYEIIAVGGESVEAYRVQYEKKDKGVRIWVDRRDRMVRMEVADEDSGLSFRLERSSKAIALRPSNTSLDSLLGVPAQRPFPDGEGLRAARFRVEGLTRTPSPTDNEVQSAAVTREADGRYTALFTVTTGPASEQPPFRLADIPRAKFAAHLRPGPLTPSGSESLKRLAKQIIGDETDARRAAQKLDRWVYNHLTYDLAYSGDRSAAETLKTRKGVCQNYATLLVTLARAAGIPAKYCAGLAYAEKSYQLHGWAELWTGKWVAFEPTWRQSFADAARIKFHEGEPGRGLDRFPWKLDAPPTVRFLPAGADGVADAPAAVAPEAPAASFSAAPPSAPEAATPRP